MLICNVGHTLFYSCTVIICFEVELLHIVIAIVFIMINKINIKMYFLYISDYTNLPYMAICIFLNAYKNVFCPAYISIQENTFTYITFEEKRCFL